MPTLTNKEIELREKLVKTYKNNDNSISFFPFGGDAYDFDIENCLKFINLAVQEAVAEERKAFGGCLNCYGKGYATQMVHAGSSRHGVWELDPIRFCECDRGKQLEKLITNHKV